MPGRAGLLKTGLLKVSASKSTATASLNIARNSCTASRHTLKASWSPEAAGAFERPPPCRPALLSAPPVAQTQRTLVRGGLLSSRRVPAEDRRRWGGEISSPEEDRRRWSGSTRGDPKRGAGWGGTTGGCCFAAGRTGQATRWGMPQPRLASSPCVAASARPESATVAWRRGDSEPGRPRSSRPIPRGSWASNRDAVAAVLGEVGLKPVRRAPGSWSSRARHRESRPTKKGRR
mmetsp:Transcript_68855/g.155765  ORF Transcript_68855/g.155765 Transcript_68855/m.155765 type:complete len:233 (+) Transcript_68855:1066-1764(+)